jgi:hypothetical protein
MRRLRIITFFLVSMPCLINAQSFLDSGLVAFYPLNGNANDYSGYSPNGIKYDVWPVDDHNGDSCRAYYFDGTASRIDVTKDEFVNNTLSVSFFIRITDVLTYSFCLACSDFCLFTDADSVGMLITRQTVPTMQMVRAYSQINMWTHVVGTYDGQNIRLYINGAIADSVYHPGIITDPNWDLTIGTFGGNYWKGEFDELRIYNRVLTPSEISDFYVYYGIPEYISQSRIDVWPNPCNDILNFSCEKISNPNVRLYDISGKCVFSENNPGMQSGGYYSIDVSTIPAGVYLLRCSSGSNVVDRKISILR